MNNPLREIVSCSVHQRSSNYSRVEENRTREYLGMDFSLPFMPSSAFRSIIAALVLNIHRSPSDSTGCGTVLKAAKRSTGHEINKTANIEAICTVRNFEGEEALKPTTDD